MRPVEFPEANTSFGPPPGLEESQCRRVAAFRGVIQGGSVDGVPVVVVAWKPDALDLEVLKKDGIIYLSVIGGLPPHFLTTDFHRATHPV